MRAETNHSRRKHISAYKNYCINSTLVTFLVNSKKFPPADSSFLQEENRLQPIKAKKKKTKLATKGKKLAKRN